jgi:hypothetical protein
MGLTQHAQLTHSKLLKKKFEYAKNLESLLLCFHLYRGTLCGILLLCQQVGQVLVMTKEPVKVTFCHSLFCLSLVENKGLNVI